ncbi:MAG TPA: ABC transporter substrate-binding protein [Opitutaceae bacterium]|jgi:branched-chain amino acid transport system substrate-binding protein|nr:ABC transporter substrate-binding protein [Opitutaceae bacterium]
MSRIQTLLVSLVCLGLPLAAWAQSGKIKIGEYASLTGKEAAFGQSSHKGTVLAIEEINAAGGVLGRQLELVSEDNQSKPGESATIATKLITREKVVALLGEVASSRSIEAAIVAQKYRIPLISPSSTNPKVTEIGNYIFRVCFIDPFQGTALAKFASSHLKARRVAIVTSVSSAYSVGLAKFFREQFVADGGQVVLEQKYSEGDKDFKAQLTAIKAAAPDAIFVPGYYTEAALMCKQARDLGLKQPLFGGDGWEAPELITIGGKAVEGCYYSTHYSPEIPTEAVKTFVKRFKARWNGETPDAMAALGYDSALVLVDAIRRAGSTEADKIRSALATTKDLEGVTGRTTIDAQRNASKPAVVVEVRNGEFRFVQSVAP